MTDKTECKHKQSTIANSKRYKCSTCGKSTHKRCLVKSKNGEQCWLVKGHEHSKLEMDREHMALVIAN